jgi:hypothetical protein
LCSIEHQFEINLLSANQSQLAVFEFKADSTMFMIPSREGHRTLPAFSSLVGSVLDFFGGSVPDSSSVQSRAAVYSYSYCCCHSSSNPTQIESRFWLAAGFPSSPEK